MQRGQERNRAGPERTALPPTPMRFSTQSLEARDRLPLWQDLLCRSLTGCRVRISEWADGFSADMDLVAGERVSIAHSNTYGIGTVRDRDCIRDDDDHLMFFMKLNGTSQMQLRDTRLILNPGDAVLVDYTEQFDMQAVGTLCDLLVLRLPRTMVSGRAARQTVGLHQRSGSPMLRLLSTYAEEVFRAGADGLGLQPIAERHLAELVGALCLEPTDQVGTATGAAALNQARLLAIREEIARAYEDPCLNLRRVSGRLGFSERLGQLILNREGLSFTELLQQHRLERAYERLAFAAERVTDVAYGVGFSDLSHFHRLFKARFGHTPGETHEAARDADHRLQRKK
jgi:AraC-like DNA-binding protein